MINDISFGFNLFYFSFSLSNFSISAYFIWVVTLFSVVKAASLHFHSSYLYLTYICIIILYSISYNYILLNTKRITLSVGKQKRLCASMLYMCLYVNKILN